ncbi:hypothetical protein DFJ73DRAFT_316492 [Zopfochytrium polystomum]|nr:hypothetical protein DFJ73DRAFT_316492 [Zopfochytrium polystomum]
MFPFFSTCVLCTTLSNGLALLEHSELEQPAACECITLFFQDMVDSAETSFKIMGCIGGVLCFSWRAHQFLTHLVFFLMFPFFPTCVLCTTLSNGLALSEHSELEQPADGECIPLFFQGVNDSAETPFKIMGCIGGVLCFSWRAHQFLTHLVFFLMFPFFPLVFSAQLSQTGWLCWNILNWNNLQPVSASLCFSKTWLILQKHHSKLWVALGGFCVSVGVLTNF